MSSSFNFGYNRIERELDENSGTCHGKVICCHCGRKYGTCGDVESILLERDEMLKRQQSGSDGRKTRAGAGLTYLKIEHLSIDKRTCRIQAARQEKDKWDNDSVVLRVTYNSQTFLFQVNSKSPNYNILIDLFGDNEETWPGNEFLIYLQQDVVTERYWPHVEAKPVESKASKK